MQDVSTARDDASIYDDATDATDAIVASGLTGHATPPAPKTRTPMPKTMERVTLLSQALLGPPSSAPASLDGPRKRHRQRAPSPSPLDDAEDITGTPRSTRVARLFPGGSGASAKPLTVLVQRLLDVSKATLVPKSKRAKTISVDIESAADVLVLIGLIQEQASLMEARRVVFDPNRQTAPSPSPSTFAPNAQFEFRHDALSAKVDMLSDQMSKLVTAIMPDPQRQPPAR